MDVVLAAGILALSVRPARAALAARNGEIAFQWKDSSGNYVSVYVVNADGSGRRKLLSDAGEAAWSPNGKKVAFVRNATDSSNEIDADGGRQKKILDNAGSPAWSPNGKKIAFVRALGGADGSDAIEIANADGSSPTRLLAGAVGKPAWSSDGQKIAFEWYVFVRRGGSGYPVPEIGVINADGSGQKRLTAVHSLQGNMQPTWSPDSKKIAFASDHCFPEPICPRGQQISVTSTS